MIRTSEILQGDALTVLRTLPDESIHCVITSPPYYGLRDYGCEGQIGLEKTPEEYIDRIVAVFREVRRVLRDDGTLWLNLADSYAGSGQAWGKQDRLTPSEQDRLTPSKPDRPFRSSTEKRQDDSEQGPTVVGIKRAWCKEFGYGRPAHYISGKQPSGLKPKDLTGIPWRVALALQADGWWLRSDIIWLKSNPMPESVMDRPTKSHEYIFLLAKKERYFYDADAVREEPAEWYGNKPDEYEGKLFNWTKQIGGIRTKGKWSNPKGRHKRTVWVIPTEGTAESHFATFPRKLVEPCILAGTSRRGVCPECGGPYQRVREKQDLRHWTERRNHTVKWGLGAAHGRNDGGSHFQSASVPVGWQATCAHNERPVPAIVLDPFVGSGTTCVVADALGRRWLGIELKPEYIRMARTRIERATRQRRLPLEFQA